jgi:hypothetical protein
MGGRAYPAWRLSPARCIQLDTSGRSLAEDPRALPPPHYITRLRHPATTPRRNRLPGRGGANKRQRGGASGLQPVGHGDVFGPQDVVYHVPGGPVRACACVCARCAPTSARAWQASAGAGPSLHARLAAGRANLRPPPRPQVPGHEPVAANSGGHGGASVRGAGYHVLRAEDPPGYELLCLVPGYMLHEVKVGRGARGRMLLCLVPAARCMPWG